MRLNSLSLYLQHRSVSDQNNKHKYIKQNKMIYIYIYIYEVPHAVILRGQII